MLIDRVFDGFDGLVSSPPTLFEGYRIECKRSNFPVSINRQGTAALFTNSRIRAYERMAVEKAVTNARVTLAMRLD